MIDKSGFVTPPNHDNFLAKKFYFDDAKVVDTAIAYMTKNGGGPTTMHSHPHNHLFFVVKGQAKVCFENETIIIKENDSFLVQGNRLHSVWNDIDGETIMIGMTLI